MIRTEQEATSVKGVVNHTQMSLHSVSEGFRNLLVSFSNIEIFVSHELWNDEAKKCTHSIFSFIILYQLLRIRNSSSITLGIHMICDENVLLFTFSFLFSFTRYCFDLSQKIDVRGVFHVVRGSYKYKKLICKCGFQMTMIHKVTPLLNNQL